MTICYRLLLCLMACLCVLASCTQSNKADLWGLYKIHFLNEDGSIVDSVNGNIRHSEGQGVGMLLAVANHDKASFDHLWLWTQQHLQVRKGDALMAWRWRSELPHVNDSNNASDGDILIAWALLRANEQWNEKVYADSAKEILQDIRQSLVVYHQGRMLLLPGKQGFKQPEGDMINLSYWIFPAFLAFQKFEPNELVWPSLIQSGLKLLDEAQFGVWKLAPDWLMVGNHLYPASQFPKRFGLDAVRIPLYLQWGGFSDHSVIKNASHFWHLFTGFGAWPEWVSLDDTNVHMADKVPGLQAIASYISPNEHVNIQSDWQQAEYYQMTLALLSQLAEEESVQ